MLIYPAIDLIGGRCVRLLRGDFNEATFYETAPSEVLRSYETAGAEWAHIVDLDGAKAGERRQHDVLFGLARSSGLKLQLAGGVRSRNDVEDLLEAGASRVVVGSRAVEDPDDVFSWLDEFGADSIALAFDVNIVDGTPYAATKGWKETSDKTLFALLDLFPESVANHVLITNIARDGAMTGPDVALYESVLAQRPDLALQASGGVRDTNDIEALSSAGAAAAIVGRALFENRIELGEAIRAGA